MTIANQKSYYKIIKSEQRTKDYNHHKGGLQKMAKKKKVEDDFEEDWFEDDDWDEEEEKPKKKKSRKKKEKSYAWVWVLAFIAILAILLLIRYKYSAAPQTIEDNSNASETQPPVEENTVYVPEGDNSDNGNYDNENYGREYDGGVKDLGPAVVTDEDIKTGEYKQKTLLGEPTNSDEQHAIDITDKPQLFSNIDCQYDPESGIPYISLRIYNTLNKTILISPRGVAKGYNTYFMIRGIVDEDPGCDTEIVEPGQWTECKRIGFDGKKYANVAGINRISIEVPDKTEALLVNCPEPPVFDEEGQ